MLDNTIQAKNESDARTVISEARIHAADIILGSTLAERLTEWSRGDLQRILDRDESFEGDIVVTFATLLDKPTLGGCDLRLGYDSRFGSGYEVAEDGTIHATLTRVGGVSWPSHGTEDLETATARATTYVEVCALLKRIHDVTPVAVRFCKRTAEEHRAAEAKRREEAEAANVLRRLTEAVTAVSNGMRVNARRVRWDGPLGNPQRQSHRHRRG